MTKFQWEQRLVGYLMDLPEDEKRRVLDYYNELFCDKFENGECEEYIIDSFGDPSAIALEILKSFGDRDGYTPAATNQTGQPPISGYNQPAVGAYNQPVGTQPPFDGHNRPSVNSQSQVNPHGQTFGQPSAHTQSAVGGCVKPPARNAQGQGTANSQQPPSIPPVSSRDYYSYHKRPPHPLTIVVIAFFFVVVGIPLICSLIAVLISLAAAIFSIAISAVGMLLYGIIGIFMGVGVAQTLIILGVGLVLCAISLVLLPLSFKCVKLAAKALPKAIRSLFRLILGRTDVRASA